MDQELLTVYHGRPEDLSGRIPAEVATYDFLDKLNIEYDRVDHEPAMSDDIYAKMDSSLVSTACKNLFLVNRQGTKFYLLMMPRNKDFRTRFLKEQLGLAHLSFAKEEQMVEYLGVHPGSVSIMCLLKDIDAKVELIIDKDVFSGDTVRFHPCINTSSIRISTKDFTNIVIPALNHEPTLINIPDFK